MKPLAYVLLIGGLLSALMPASLASDLTDAMSGVDPRKRLQSGTGSAYGRVYGPEDDQTASPPDESEAFYFPRSPSLYDRAQPSEDAGSPLDDNPLEGSPSRSNPLRPSTAPANLLGHPGRPTGVWYEDGLQPTE